MNPENINIPARHIVNLGITSCFKEGDYSAAICGVVMYPFAVFYAWLLKRQYNRGIDPYA